MTSGGRARTAIVHEPPGFDGTSPTPLVVVFHYARGNPASMDRNTDLDRAADEAGFVLAYPAGIGESFDAGKCCGKAWEDGVDDVAFARDLLDALVREPGIDARRVFVTGMSNGGMMTYRVGCELADRLAGIGVVSGAVHMNAPCEPARPLPVLHIHGTADEVVPYDGGVGHLSVGPPIAGEHDFISVAESTGIWRTRDDTDEAPVETYRHGDASCVAWRGGDDDTEVRLCTIDGGGHTWPDGSLPSWLGKTSHDLDASRAILAFFAEQRPR